MIYHRCSWSQLSLLGKKNLLILFAHMRVCSQFSRTFQERERNTRSQVYAREREFFGVFICEEENIMKFIMPYDSHSTQKFIFVLTQHCSLRSSQQLSLLLLNLFWKINEIGDGGRKYADLYFFLNEFLCVINLKLFFQWSRKNNTQ